MSSSPATCPAVLPVLPVLRINSTTSALHSGGKNRRRRGIGLPSRGPGPHLGCPPSRVNSSSAADAGSGPGHSRLGAVLHQLDTGLAVGSANDQQVAAGNDSDRAGRDLETSDTEWRSGTLTFVPLPGQLLDRAGEGRLEVDQL